MEEEEEDEESSSSSLTVSPISVDLDKQHELNSYAKVEVNILIKIYLDKSRRLIWSLNYLDYRSIKANCIRPLTFREHYRVSDNGKKKCKQAVRKGLI